MYRTQSAALTDDRTAETKNYFEEGVFSTGYATHGLFPYRGKFHPQLIKALINIIGLERGEWLLDPMCGSGTANIEAALMGINSYAIDLSPFCKFMTKVKYNSLLINTVALENISRKANEFFKFFSTKGIQSKLTEIPDEEKRRVYELALLAFLDALGYSKRVSSSTHQQLFLKVLKRYEETVIDFHKNKINSLAQFGKLEVLDDNALSISLGDNTVDGVITSPPYSFAIDYIKNDEAQFNYFGYDVDGIRRNMVGLRGRNRDERLENYFVDMDKVCSEIARVLKDKRFFVMIIGSNTNQTGGIRLEQRIIESCNKYNLKLVKSILKPIKGLRNTMKDEYILFFKKEV
jgi:DNA modification methylase